MVVVGVVLTAVEFVLVLAEGLRGLVRRRCREGSRYRRHSDFPLVVQSFGWPASGEVDGLGVASSDKGVTKPKGDSWRLLIFSSNVAVMALSKSLPVTNKHWFKILAHNTIKKNKSHSYWLTDMFFNQCFNKIKTIIFTFICYSCTFFDIW